MQIKLNGKAFESEAATLLALTELLALNPRQVAIERNREIVPRGRYGEVALSAGDEIEIVHFIGGG